MTTGFSPPGLQDISQRLNRYTQLGLRGKELDLEQLALVAQTVKNLPAMQETLVRFLVGKIPWRSDSGYPLQYSWASLVAQTIKNHLQCGRSEFDPWVEKTPWRKVWQPTPVLLPGVSSWTEKPGRLQSMESQRVGHE